MKTIITILSLSLLLTGCSNDNTDKKISEETVFVQQEESPIEETENINGDLYYIKNILTTNGKTSIEIDKIKWLSSTENTCSTPPELKDTMPQCNSNGFLIENNSSADIKTYEILPSANIQTTNFGSNPSATTKINLEELNKAWNEQKGYFQFAPFVIQIENDTVTAIQEKYIP